MTIKVLQLEGWMTWVGFREETLATYKQRQPSFNRPGIYKRRGRCWFELEDGRAFKYRVEDFDYKLSLLHAEKYNARQIQALAGIIAQGLATKDQKAAWRLCHDLAQLRNTKRSASLWRLKFDKEFKDV